MFLPYVIVRVVRGKRKQLISIVFHYTDEYIASPVTAGDDVK